MTHLPGGSEAVLDIRKIADYCLNPLHPRGRHKAHVFRQALNLSESDAPWLREILLQAAHSGEALHMSTDDWGDHWRLDVPIRRQGRSAVVRTIWIVLNGEHVARFVTCWVL